MKIVILYAYIFYTRAAPILLFLLLIFLLTPFFLFSSCTNERTFLLPRSQATHTERQLGERIYQNIFLGSERGRTNLNTTNANTAAIGLMVNAGYSQSFDGSSIANYFFGNTVCNNTLTCSGSLVADRKSTDILADYFGLPTDFKSKISFCPEVQNVFLDMAFFANLDCLYDGLYFYMYSPLVYSAADMGMHECIVNQGNRDYHAGYMANRMVSRSEMATDMQDWFAGRGAGFGDLQPLSYGRIDGKRSKIGFADMQAQVGWKPIVTDTAFLSLGLTATIPTGTKSDGIYLLQPMIGNGGFWECGVDIAGYTDIVEWHDSCRNLSLYGNIRLSHFFTSIQKRSFDFKKNGPNSRYMLMQEMGNPLIEGLNFGNNTKNRAENSARGNARNSAEKSGENGVIEMDMQYHGVILPAINKTTFDIQTTIACQATIAAALRYQFRSSTIDIGYNFWTRTAERCKGRSAIPYNVYAIKGDGQPYGYTTGASSVGYIGLNATQSKATIHAGQKSVTGNVVGSTHFTNSNGDNRAPIFFGFDSEQHFLTFQESSGNQLNGSNPVILINDTDVDTESGLSPAVCTHTLFAAYAYDWCLTEEIASNVGCGFEVTCAGKGNKGILPFSEWSFWIRGSLFY